MIHRFTGNNESYTIASLQPQLEKCFFWLIFEQVFLFIYYVPIYFLLMNFSKPIIEDSNDQRGQVPTNLGQDNKNNNTESTYFRPSNNHGSAMRKSEDLTMEQKRNLHKKMHADRVDEANKFIKRLENPQSSSSLDENKNSDNSNSHTSKESLS